MTRAWMPMSWAVLLVLVCASLAHAQPLPKLPAKVELPPVAWSVAHQRTAELFSNVTLWTNVGLETYAAWQATDRKHAFLVEGERIAFVELGTDLIKVLVHRTRPCAPDCGTSDPNKSFPSGHTSLAFTATGDRLALTLTLASATGYFRMASNRHWLTDVVAGAAIGSAATFIR